MRVAAIADIHFNAPAWEKVREKMERVRDEADVLIIAGDLTNYGKISEMEVIVNVLIRLRIPIVAVLGNHDHESDQQDQLTKMMAGEGIKVLDGTGYERDGVGFAGTKGFIGGFGREMLTAFGEREVKSFVQAAVDEALKLERALSQLTTQKRVVVLHYSPIPATVAGEAREVLPFLGTSRLAEVIDRHGANLVVHGHAHHGTPDGKTTAGIPVHNVSLNLLQTENPPRAFRVFDV